MVKMERVIEPRLSED